MAWVGKDIEDSPVPALCYGQRHLSWDQTAPTPSILAWAVLWLLEASTESDTASSYLGLLVNTTGTPEP